jgi:hypothetical protein
MPKEMDIGKRSSQSRVKNKLTKNKIYDCGPE